MLRERAVVTASSPQFWRKQVSELTQPHIERIMAPKRLPRRMWKPSTDGAQQRLAGSDLFHHLVGIYVSGRQMTAKDLAVGCYFCARAGIGGAHWDWWGMAPGKQSGKYKDHVDKRMPAVGAMMKITIPMQVRGRAHLTKASTDVQLVFESISEEVLHDDVCRQTLEYGADDLNSVMLTRSYQNHAHVQQ
eukprot:3238307-Pyramimonas_sp.AAC.1